MCNLYSITTNQAAIAALFRVVVAALGVSVAPNKAAERRAALDHLRRLAKLRFARCQR
jgi:hypothetical protein